MRSVWVVAFVFSLLVSIGEAVALPTEQELATTANTPSQLGLTAVAPQANSNDPLIGNKSYFAGPVCAVPGEVFCHISADPCNDKYYCTKPALCTTAQDCATQCPCDIKWRECIDRCAKPREEPIGKRM